ncbi:MAG: DUF2304 domain-containing protein [Solirubrobacterales bacterium]
MTKVTLQRGFAIAVTFALLMLVLELVRRKRLSERYAILWLIAAATLFILAVWKGLLTSLSHDVGIYYPPSALFAVAIGLILMILLHFSLAVSRLADQNKVLAQRLGLLQQQVQENDVSEQIDLLAMEDRSPRQDPVAAQSGGELTT